MHCLGAPRSIGMRRDHRTLSLHDDEYFVLGDNSPVSNDSRFWSGQPGGARGRCSWASRSWCTSPGRSWRSRSSGDPFTGFPIPENPLHSIGMIPRGDGLGSRSRGLVWRDVGAMLAREPGDARMAPAKSRKGKSRRWDGPFPQTVMPPPASRTKELAEAPAHGGLSRHRRGDRRGLHSRPGGPGVRGPGVRDSHRLDGPNLDGPATRKLTCPQCGFVYAVNASQEVEGPSIRAELTRDLRQLPVSGARLERAPQLQGRSHPGDDVPLRPAFPAWERAGPSDGTSSYSAIPEEPEVSYIKRLVGLPGETIRIAHGDVYIKPPGGDYSGWSGNR